MVVLLRPDSVARHVEHETIAAQTTLGQKEGCHRLEPSQVDAPLEVSGIAATKPRIAPRRFHVLQACETLAHGRLGVVPPPLSLGGLGAAIGSEGLGVVHRVPLAARIPYLLAVLTAFWHIVPKAWRAARCLRPDMNLLMAVAVLGAIGIGEWFEAATVAFLFALSLALESWSVRRARRVVAALMELAPPAARIKKPDGTEERVPPEQVPVGAHFVVMPSEKFPLDGRVVGGFSEVNQAPITGESVPVPKQSGDQVFAATINGDGALELECTKLANDTTLAHIIRMVAEAQSRRAPSEQRVEKFARVY